MRKVKLPTGYRQVKCIISNGTQYVETGVTGKSGVAAEMTFELAATKGVLLGSYGSSGRMYPLMVDGTSFQYAYGEITTISGVTAARGKKYSAACSMLAGSQTISINGVTVVNATDTTTYNTGQTMALFGNRYNSSTVIDYASIKLYECKIYEGNTLARDYIPCISPTGAVGLYDLVTAAFFGNAGTGTFGFENLPIVELPKGYRQLESIESTGTQYINTTFKPNQDTRAVLDVQMTAENASLAANDIFGARTSTSSKAFAVQWNTANNYFQHFYNNGLDNLDFGDFNKRQVMDMNKNVLTLDGVSHTRTYAAFKCDYSMYLFAVNNAGTADFFSKMRLYSCRVYDNDLVVRNYIPCIDPSGSIGLYDLQNGVFYGNAGTGTFIAGRKVYTEDEIQKLEYVESTGTQYVDTEFFPTYQSRVVVDLSGLANAQGVVFGARNAANAAASQMFNVHRYNATQMRSDYFGTAVYVSVSDTTGRSIIDKNANVMTAYGVTATNTAVTSGVSSNSLYLFALNTNGTAGTFASFKMHSCQAYDNGFITRDYYPATVDGAVGLWDAESGVLYESATDALIAGPIVYNGPQMPQNLRVESVDAESITLAWDAAESTTYRVYLDGYLLSEQTAGTYTGKFEPFSFISYEVTAYDGELESEPATVEAVFTPANPILYLITDRTRLDLNEAIAMQNKSFEELTDAEKEKYLFSMRGAYNAPDLNRVGLAINYVAETMRTVGYTISVDPKTDWEKSDFPTQALMAAYIDNVNALRNAFATLPTTPDTPADMEKLTWQEANHIEQILFDLDYLLSRVALAWVYSGEIYSGEV